MNKKQLIVAWVMGIYLCIFIFYKQYVYPQIMTKIKLGLEPSYLTKSLAPIYPFVYYSIFPVLILGSLLIYTLRDKKK